MLATYTFTPAFKMETLLLALKRDKLLHFSELFCAGAESWLIRCTDKKRRIGSLQNDPSQKPYPSQTSDSAFVKASQSVNRAVLANADQPLDNLVGASYCMA